MRWIRRIPEDYGISTPISQVLYGFALQNGWANLEGSFEALIPQTHGDNTEIDRTELARQRLEAAAADTVDRWMGLRHEMRTGSSGMKRTLPRSSFNKIRSSKIKRLDEELQSVAKRGGEIDEAALFGFGAAAALEYYFTKRITKKYRKKFGTRTRD